MSEGVDVWTRNGVPGFVDESVYVRHLIQVMPDHDGSFAGCWFCGKPTSERLAHFMAENERRVMQLFGVRHREGPRPPWL